MKRYRLGWKVTSSDLRSYMECYRQSEVQYGFGKVSRPRAKCGPLCVFDTKESARDAFVGGELYPCAYIQSSHTEIWNRYGDRLTKMLSGTVLADEVILLREVKP